MLRRSWISKWVAEPIKAVRWPTYGTALVLAATGWGPPFTPRSTPHAVDGRGGNRGAGKRHTYSNEEKAGVLDHIDAVEAAGGMMKDVLNDAEALQEYPWLRDDRFDDGGMLSKWRKKSEAIRTAALDDNRKQLNFSIGRRGTPAKWPLLETPAAPSFPYLGGELWDKGLLYNFPGLGWQFGVVIWVSLNGEGLRLRMAAEEGDAGEVEFVRPLLMHYAHGPLAAVEGLGEEAWQLFERVGAPPPAT